MTRDAESHAGEDKKRRALAEAKNEADTLVYSVEQSVKELGDKLDAAEKADIEKALEECRKEKETATDADTLRKAIDRLTQASHKIAEHVYKHAQAEAGAHAGAGPGAGTSEKADGQGAEGEEKVVEAEFEEEDKK